jgi:hypothetical protein
MRYFLKSGNEQRALASTIVQGDMMGLQRNWTDLIPYEDDFNDEQDDEPGVLEDDISESSMEENVSEDTGDEQMGDIMMNHWKKRSEKFLTDIAIARWMCSADPLVMKDVNNNHKGDH